MLSIFRGSSTFRSLVMKHSSIFKRPFLVFCMVLVSSASNASINFDNDQQDIVNKNFYNSATADYLERVQTNIESLYTDIFEQYGAKFSFVYLPNNNRIVAEAKRRYDDWIVSFSEGLVNHPRMSEDVLAMIACHEVAHHIGGAPKKELLYAGSEGQSDYWAAQKCFKDYIPLTDWTPKSVGIENNDIISTEEAVLLKYECGKSYLSNEKRNICLITTVTGKKLIKFLTSFRRNPKEVSFITPSTSRVWRTNLDYPSYQCRLDTFFSASLCELKTADIIEQRDELQSGCMEQNGSTEGKRPACWYKPFSVFPH